MHLLIIEDDPFHVGQLRTMAADTRSTSVRVSHCRLAADALSFLAKQACDVVLLDLGVGDLGGPEGVARLHEAAPRVPIVVQGRSELEALEAVGSRFGAYYHLVKGHLSADELMRTLMLAIKRRRMEDQLRRKAD
jgi:DNA-binding NarL/FixJ family response regulator